MEFVNITVHIRLIVRKEHENVFVSVGRRIEGVFFATTG